MDTLMGMIFQEIPIAFFDKKSVGVEYNNCLTVSMYTSSC